MSSGRNSAGSVSVRAVSGGSGALSRSRPPSSKASQALPVEVACSGQRVPIFAVAATTWLPGTSSRISMLFSKGTSSVAVSPMSRASARSTGRTRRRRSLLASAWTPSAIRPGPRL